MTSARDRILTALLTIAMVCSATPISAFADAQGGGAADEGIVQLDPSDDAASSSNPSITEEGPADIEQELTDAEDPSPTVESDEALVPEGNPIEVPTTPEADQTADSTTLRDSNNDANTDAIPTLTDRPTGRERAPHPDPNADRVQLNPELTQGLTNLSAQSSDDENSNLATAKADKGITLQIQSTASLNYTPYENCIWPSQTRRYVYFMASKKVENEWGGQDTVFTAYRYDMDKASVSKVCDTKSDFFYYTDDKLYIMEGAHTSYYVRDTDSYVHRLTIRTIDLRTGSETSIKMNTGDSPSQFGVDHQGRLYVQYYPEKEDGYVMRIYDSAGKTLATKKNVPNNYGFAGFDKQNGNFYFMGYYNWIYFGYDHDMTALKVGNFDGSKITVNDEPISIAYQSWFFEHSGCAEMLNGRYLADLSTFNGDLLTILDSHAIGVNDVSDTVTSISLIDGSVDVSSVALPAKTIILGARTHDSEYVDDYDVSGVGSRSAYIKGEDSGIFAIATGRQELSLYKATTKEYLGAVRTSEPIYKVMASGSTLAILEKSSAGAFKIESAAIQFPTSIRLVGPSSVIAGGSADYGIQLDGNVQVDVTVRSSDTSVLSVDNQGHASAWKAGTARLTATTASGLTTTKTVTVTAAPALAASKVVTLGGKVFSNWNAGNYRTYGNPVTSYLVETDQGFMRVQARTSNVLIENYNTSGRLLSTKTFKHSLPIFGGYFHGADGTNYLITGRKNEANADDVVVVRIIHYDSAWNRLAACNISAANTRIPFDAGSLRVDEARGKLYIHTCHEMYTDEDGYNHQANMTFVVNEADMKLVDSYTDVMNLSEGYVSHSFNQFVRTDGNYVYRVDHGDAGPRGIAFTKTPLDGSIGNPTLYGTLTRFKDDSYYNYTGASVGGFELSETHAIVAWNEDVSDDYNASRNVFVTSLPKEGGTAQTVKLTNYSKNVTCYTPQLVKVDGRHLIAMWTEYNQTTGVYKMAFARIDQAGGRAGSVVRKVIPQSDCQPIMLSDGTISWFVSSDRVVKLYKVNPYALSAAKEDPFSDETMTSKDINWYAYVEPVISRTWSGKASRPKPKVIADGVTLREGTDYTLSYKNNDRVGTATIVVTGKGDYKGQITSNFTITPRNLSSTTVTLSKTSYAYDGTAKKPTVTVAYNSTKFSADSYTVTYPSGCKNVGTYEVTITGTGNCTGTVKRTFKIEKGTNPSTFTAKTVDVSYADLTGASQTVTAITGSNRTGTASYQKTSGSANVTVNAKTGKVTVKKGTAKGTYTIKVKVSVAATANYKALTKELTFKVVVK